MNEMYIVSFNSTHHAIKTDKILSQSGVTSTTLPTPREITASCGISIRFLFNDIEYKGIFKITRLEDGKREVNQIN